MKGTGPRQAVAHGRGAHRGAGHPQQPPGRRGSLPPPGRQAAPGLGAGPFLGPMAPSAVGGGVIWPPAADWMPSSNLFSAQDSLPYQLMFHERILEMIDSGGCQLAAFFGYPSHGHDRRLWPRAHGRLLAPSRRHPAHRISLRCLSLAPLLTAVARCFVTRRVAAECAQHQ